MADCASRSCRRRSATNFSEVPPGLEKWVNDTDNWAARGTFLFAPTLDRLYFSSQRGTSGFITGVDGVTYEVSGPFFI